MVRVQVGNSSNGIKEYVVDSDGNVSNVTITNGTEAIGVIDPSLYGTWADNANNKEVKYVGKISINIATIISEIGVTNVNDVTITISFQRYNWFFGVTWPSYETPVNAYKGSSSSTALVTNGTGTATVKYKITDDDFATNNLKITQLTLSKQGANNADFYNLEDYRNRKELNLTMKSNFIFNGEIKACISSTTKCTTLTFNSESNTSSNTSTVNVFSIAVSNNVEQTVTFNGFTIQNAKDLYGSSITKLNFDQGIVSNVSFLLDTKAPTITSAGVSNANGSLFYDISEIYPILNLSEDVTYEDLKFKFQIGESENELILDDTDNHGDSYNKRIGKTVYLSGNGLVKLVSFYVTLVDGVGNQKTYIYSQSSSLCNANDEVELVSSIISASSDKAYYYQGELLEVEVELANSTVNLNDFESIYLNTSSGTIYHTFTSYGKVDNMVTFNLVIGDEVVTINNIVFTKLKDNVSNKVASLTLNLNMNQYLELDVSDLYNPSNKSFSLYNNVDNESEYEIETFDDALLEYASESIETLTCSAISGVSCQYTSKGDGIDHITVKTGAIVLANGIKNLEQSFNLTINERNPNVSYILNNVYEYENKNYYKYGNGVVTINLEDGYGEMSCIYYKVNDGQYIESCTLGDTSQLIVTLPHEAGEYSLTYYTSDNLNQGQPVILDEVFVYRGTFEINDIDITVNQMEIESVNGNNEYNYVSVSYENGAREDLLKEFKVSIVAKGISKVCSLVESCTIDIPKAELGSIDDMAMISIFLTDHLGNGYEYLVNVNLDTIIPSFDNLDVTIGDDNLQYSVNISSYDPYSLAVKVDGVVIDLVNDSFVTDKEMFTIYLTDKAGNINSRVFTTVSPYIELFLLNNGSSNVTYEINISPFNSSIHTIEDSRYLVFDYLEDITDNDILVAKSNVCTAGRKVNCYVEGNYSSDVGLINQAFARGYSYILLVKINNVLVNLKETSTLPRLDVVGADKIAPEGMFLDDDINPDYISSVSGKAFKFSFLARDINLTNSYYYLIVESSLSINIDKFYDLYTNCYGALASSNKCGIKGSNTYVEKQGDDISLGEVIIEANNNTRKRFVDNTSYSLYVLISDAASNESLFKVREFINISKSSVVEYKRDDGFSVADESEISTDSTTEIKVVKYLDVDVEKVLVNDNDISCSSDGCNYVLVAGRHEVVVTDVLGNVSSFVFYSAMARKPIIQIEYLYGGEYYKLSDTSYSYNTSNTGNIYVKVSGNNLDSVTLAMGGISKVYQEGSELYDSITSLSNLHGITLYQLISLHTSSSDYDGIINLSATNEDGGVSTISMQVDNTAPQITLALPGSNINLVGTQYKLASESGVYSIEFNYKSDITYAYLLQALLVKIDGVDVLSMIDIERLKIKLDGTIIEDLYSSITKGEKLITIDYFDNAGNNATQIKIKVIVVDNEAPVIILRNIKDVMELNVSDSLAEVIATDNHDQELVIKATIDGNEIDYTNYKFLNVGTYTITYSVKDSSGKEAIATQVILVKDTVAPTLMEGTVTTYNVGIDDVLEFSMPKFIDTDASFSEYYPHQIKVLGLMGEELDSTLINYPLSYDSNLVRIRFNNGYELGVYKVIFVAKDNVNNIVVSEFLITLKDMSAPQISITINGNEVADSSVNIFPFNSQIIIDAKASDIYEGSLTDGIIKTITLNGNKVSSIDTSSSGDYLVEFKVVDGSGNEGFASITIKIANDNVLPNIDRVLINEIEISEGILNKFNANNLNINVVASDDSNQVDVNIIIDDFYTIRNGATISLESGLNGYVFNICVEVKDSSNNLIVKNYEIIVDNVNPIVIGVNDNQIYTSKVSLEVSDNNIKHIDIKKDGEIVDSFATNIYNYEISENGIYSIMAVDNYGNETVTNFIVSNQNKYTIVDENNNTTEIEFDFALLLETRIDNGTLTFILNKSQEFNKNDQIYILVKYPDSSYKYVIYSMNGDAYNTGSTIMIEQQIIDGVENSALLEKIGDRYYGYAMVVKADVEENVVEDNNANIGKIFMIILGVFAGIALIIIIIKIRGRVRAV